MSSTTWYRVEGDVLVLSVHAQPGAKRTEIQGLHGDALKIRVAAPPVEGAANHALRTFLAATFSVPVRNVQLKSGETSRQKCFVIHGVGADRVANLETLIV